LHSPSLVGFLRGISRVGFQLTASAKGSRPNLEMVTNPIPKRRFMKCLTMINLAFLLS
ncbi:unnamed protein product, partial [Musa hybrid cultivar]